MHVPRIDLTPVGGGPDRRLPLLLDEGWTMGMARSAISYDPDVVDTLSLPPLRFYHLPGRRTRPRIAPHAGETHRLDRAHRPCPFDDEEFLREREVLRLVGRGDDGAERTYHFALNKYPVLRQHYLAVRPAADAPETLPQRLHGAAEIEDMARLAALLGHPYRLFFNSNQGADGSRSGSSVNHWHFQAFPWSEGVLEGRPRIECGPGRLGPAVEEGRLAGWPARHRLYRSSDPRAMAKALWRDLERITARDAAYNLEISPRPEGPLLALLFPRARVEDLVLPDGSVVSGDFGGCELTGGVVVPTPEAMAWLRAHPREAVEAVMERLAASTVEPPV